MNITAFQFVNLLGHDGHGTGPIGSGESWLHYLFEMQHAPLWITCAIAFYVCYRWIRSSLAAAKDVPRRRS